MTSVTFCLALAIPFANENASGITPSRLILQHIFIWKVAKYSKKGISLRLGIVSDLLCGFNKFNVAKYERYC
jgi:hypothetical protein